MSDRARCELCGEPMPPGEEMFKYHGYSCDCPKPPLNPPFVDYGVIHDPNILVAPVDYVLKEPALYIAFSGDHIRFWTSSEGHAREWSAENGVKVETFYSSAQMMLALDETSIARNVKVERENAGLRAELVKMQKELDEAQAACRLAMNAFERSDCIDWSVVERIALKAKP